MITVRVKTAEQECIALTAYAIFVQMENALMKRTVHVYRALHCSTVCVDNVLHVQTGQCQIKMALHA